MVVLVGKRMVDVKSIGCSSRTYEGKKKYIIMGDNEHLVQYDNEKLMDIAWNSLVDSAKKGDQLVVLLNNEEVKALSETDNENLNTIE